GAAEPGALPAGGRLRLAVGAAGPCRRLSECPAAGLPRRRGTLAVEAGGGLLPARRPGPGLVSPGRTRPSGGRGGLGGGEGRGPGVGGDAEDGVVGGARRGGAGRSASG